MKKIFIPSCFILRGYLLTAACCIAFYSQAQLGIQAGTTLTIESGTKMVLQGDLLSSVSVQGSGSIVMKGSGLQNINANGNTIPNLEIDNASNVLLTGSLKIGNNLLFTNGKLRIASADLIIISSSTITGNNSSRFVWTDGTGQLKKELTANISNYELPVGENSNYRPAYLTTSGSSFSTANFGVRLIAGADANKPPMMANYINAYWPVTNTGISGGIITVAGQYLDPSDITGTESNLAGYYFNGSNWSSSGETHNTATSQISAPVTNSSGELFAMNKFITVGIRAFLQGAYNNSTGTMSDALRSGTNVIPLSDPYRQTPYNSSFTHVSNPTTEAVAATVFNNQASVNDDIVDWVFIELRNTASPGNSVLQTRSALIQRDGDIVDIDGVSPVTFNNVSNGTYTIAIRHRNHLGLSTNPTTPQSLNETKSTAFTTNVVDLRTLTGSSIYGTSSGYTTSTHPTLGTVNLLWGGNANFNTNVRYTGLSNDKDYILVTTLANNPATVLTNVYSAADINMNKIVRYTGLTNDKDFLYITVLQSNTVTIRTQQLPN